MSAAAAAFTLIKDRALGVRRRETGAGEEERCSSRFRNESHDWNSGTSLVAIVTFSNHSLYNSGSRRFSTSDIQFKNSC